MLTSGHCVAVNAPAVLTAGAENVAACDDRAGVSV